MPQQIKVHETYLGIQPFNVLVDASPELETLVQSARELRTLPPAQRLEAVKVLAAGAMDNAYEGWQSHPDPARKELCKDVVLAQHPLSYALQHHAGCCRYQGALLLVLGLAADLGDHHYLQHAPVDARELEFSRVKTVFNDVQIAGQMHHVSVFRKTLRDPQFDYCRANPRIFEMPIGFPFPGNPCGPDRFPNEYFSYHRSPRGGLVLMSYIGQHVIIRDQS